MTPRGPTWVFPPDIVHDHDQVSFPPDDGDDDDLSIDDELSVD